MSFPKLKVVINPSAPHCSGCYFEQVRPKGQNNKCLKPHDMELSCVQRSGYEVHMGIIVEDKEKDNDRANKE